MLLLSEFTKGPALSNGITMSSGLEHDEELLGASERDDAQLLSAISEGMSRRLNRSSNDTSGWSTL
jgi:hypothetical protein